MTDGMKCIVAVVLVIGVFVGFLCWVNKMDVEDRQAAQLQEQAYTQQTLAEPKYLTVGSSTWIEFDVWGNEADHMKELLELKEKFVQDNPYKEVTNWRVVKNQNAHSTTARIFGIVIDHKPKIAAE